MRRSRSLLVHVAWLGTLALIGCKPAETRDPAAAPNGLTAAPAQRAALQPPRFEFVAPGPWQAKYGKSPPVPPPDLSLETWRVLVTQNAPLQKETPLWQPLPADRTVELEMPPGSRWSCSSSPIVVDTQADDFNTKLSAWTLTRTFRCSSDAWQTWSEYLHQTRVLPDGSHEMGPEAGALLRERAADQSEIHTFVLLRSDEEQRAATTGPPKIVPGLHVDDD
jgi:hypothetical protein